MVEKNIYKEIMLQKAVYPLILFTFILYGCGEKSGEPVEKPIIPTLTIIVPNTNLGGIMGKLKYQVTDSEDIDLFVWVADFYGNEVDGGFYLLEPERFPKVKIESNGVFQINNLEPGEYVLVVGSNPEASKPIIENGNTMIVTVSIDSITDLGSVELLR